MKVLITGTSGFIGLKLLDSLVKDFDSQNIIVISSKRGLKHETLIYSEDYSFGSVNPEIIKDVSLIIHAGSFTPKNSSERNDIEKCNTNITFTNNLLQLPLPNLKKIIYLSTLDVYSQSDLITEASSTIPESLYGLSKLYSERIIELFCSKTNIKPQVLRLGHVYGPGEEMYQKVIPLSIMKILKGEAIEIWGTGEEFRSFIYIDDVIKAIMASIYLNEMVGSINVVSDDEIKIIDLLNKISKISGMELNSKHVPTEINARDLLFDNSKMRKYLNSDFDTLEHGLLNEIEYFRGLI